MVDSQGVLVRCRRAGKREAWLRGLQQQSYADALIYGDPLYSLRQRDPEAVRRAEEQARANGERRAIGRLLSERRGLAWLGFGLACYPWPSVEPDESGITSVDQLLRLAYAEPWETYRSGGRERAAARVSRFSAMVSHGVDPTAAEQQLLREAGAPGFGGAP